MNNKNILIGTLVVLLIIAFGLFYMNHMRLEQQDAVMEQQMIEFSQQQEVLLQAQIAMQKERDANELLAKQAEEAQIMAEAQAEKERLERERMIAELNARLRKEAADRRKAEEAQLALAEKMKALELAQAEANAALAALEEASREVDQAPDLETVALMEKIERQNQTLVALADENKALKDRHQALEQQQIATEEAIIEIGGKIDIPFPEIRSPNARRKQAIYLKQRVLGNPEE